MRSLGALPPRMLPSVGESYSIRWHQLDVDESVPSAYRSSGIVRQDRKSTRLNSSHSQISYAVFCLKKKHDRDTHAATIPKPCTPALCTLLHRIQSCFLQRQVPYALAPPLARTLARCAT